MISNMGGPKLDQYLQVYFSMQMGMGMGLDMFDQDSSEVNNSTPQFQGYGMNMMPAMAMMM
jgi:hypothetical protein